MAERDINDGIAGGRVRRTAPLAGLAARTAGEAVVAALRRKATGVEDTELSARAAERYVELLGRSKGALMKAGQAISFMSVGPVVSSEYRSTVQTALGRLRADAPPMEPELARAELERELGRPTGELFADFEWNPLAAASIGQVHAARLHDGRGVAVKVQYPGVAEAIASDLKNAELLATFFKLLTGLSPMRLQLDVRQIASELGAHIHEELDYRLEARNQAAFAQAYRGHPFIHVPEVIAELSTDRVLTQELATGRRWEHALTADQELRDRWAEAIHRFGYGSVNHFRMFNADPHPGNYLFHDNGTVTFLDFGAVKHVSEQLAATKDGILRACLRGDAQGTWGASVEAGMWRASDPVSAEEIYEFWRESFEFYWREQPFTITPEHVAGWIERRNSPTGPSANAVRHMLAPADATILHRMDLGVMSVIAELRAKNHWGSMAAEFFEGELPVTALGKLEREFLAGHPTALQHA